jgi:hypothetical protein
MHGLATWFAPFSPSDTIHRSGLDSSFYRDRILRIVVRVLHSIVIGFWEFLESRGCALNEQNVNLLYLFYLPLLNWSLSRSGGGLLGSVHVEWGHGWAKNPRWSVLVPLCERISGFPWPIHIILSVGFLHKTVVKLTWTARENLWSLGNARNRGSEAQRRLSQSRGVQDSSVRRVVIRRKDWARFQPTGDGRESYLQREKKGERSGERWPKLGGECRVACAPRPCRADGLRIRPHRLLPVKFKFSGRRTQMFQILRVSPVCPTKYCSAFLFFLLAPDEDGYTGYLAVVKLVQLGYSDSEEAQKLFLKK